MQELESTANASDFALAQQSYAIRNMLSSRILIAGKYARKDVRKQGLGIVRTRKHARFRGVVLRECGVRQESITKLLGFMVYAQEDIEFLSLGICSTSYTLKKTQNPDSRVFVVFRLKVLCFLC